MQSRQLAPQNYAQQLAEIADALAAARGDAITDCLDPSCERTDVDRFVANAVGERFRMVLEENQLLGLALDDMEAVVARYLVEERRTTFSVDYCEQLRFLAWLRRTYPLSAKAADFAAYQEAEQRCLLMARKCRREHLRFQQLLARQSAVHLSPRRSSTTVELNPVRVWSRFAAPGFVSEGTSDVLFFPVGQEIRTSLLTSAKKHILCRLLTRPACSLGRLLDADKTSLGADLTASCDALLADGAIALRP